MKDGDPCGDHALCYRGQCQCAGAYHADVGIGSNCDNGACCPTFNPHKATSLLVIDAHFKLQEVYTTMVSIQDQAIEQHKMLQLELDGMEKTWKNEKFAVYLQVLILLCAHDLKPLIGSILIYFVYSSL
jgi:hypothetical protein